MLLGIKSWPSSSRGGSSSSSASSSLLLSSASSAMLQWGASHKARLLNLEHLRLYWDGGLFERLHTYLTFDRSFFQMSAKYTDFVPAIMQDFPEFLRNRMKCLTKKRRWRNDKITRKLTRRVRQTAKNDCSASFRIYKIMY